MIKKFLKVFSAIFFAVFVLVGCNNNNERSGLSVLKDYGGIKRVLYTDTVNGHSYLIVKIGNGAGICHDESCICKNKK